VKTVRTVVVIIAINIITIHPKARVRTQTSYLAKNITLFQDSITLKTAVSIRCCRDTVTESLVLGCQN